MLVKQNKQKLNKGLLSLFLLRDTIFLLEFWSNWIEMQKFSFFIFYWKKPCFFFGWKIKLPFDDSLHLKKMEILYFFVKIHIFYRYCFEFEESWPSGRRRTLGKRVCPTRVSRVRIPYSPPLL